VDNEALLAWVKRPKCEAEHTTPTRVKNILN